MRLRRDHPYESTREARPPARRAGNAELRACTPPKGPPRPQPITSARAQPPEAFRSPNREDEEGSTLGRLARKIGHGAYEPERAARIARIELPGNDGPRPAPHAGEDGDVLLAIGPAVRHRLAHDPRRDLDLPEL